MCGVAAGLRAVTKLNPVLQCRATVNTPRLMNIKLMSDSMTVVLGQLKVSSLELLPRKADTSLPTSLRNLAPSLTQRPPQTLELTNGK
ncbi:hypothetical protein FOZ61_009505 [Perkinsus olseni]|uniref:Uncharacterized protein n=1 Tax=Perkinsus olseni TaxID=32597 RepID=A0A7J6MG91_PEROL|nr:hypothetical protein FOZ61_009505 [Perkinsus olseni]